MFIIAPTAGQHDLPGSTGIGHGVASRMLLGYLMQTAQLLAASGQSASPKSAHVASLITASNIVASNPVCARHITWRYILMLSQDI